MADAVGSGGTGPPGIESSPAQWELLDKQLDELEQTIGELTLRNPTAVIIATLPGVGAYGSLALASRIGSIERFPHARSLANYWGLTPGSNNSGDQQRRLGSITKEGSAIARFILAQIVVHVLRRDAKLKEWYRRIKKRRGSKIVRVAVMRRLATIIWYMVKYQRPYRPGGTPVATTAANALRGCRIRNAFFEEIQGRSRKQKEKGCQGIETVAASSPTAPLTWLSLVGMLASRARLRFTKQAIIG